MHYELVQSSVNLHHGPKPTINEGYTKRLNWPKAFVLTALFVAGCCAYSIHRDCEHLRKKSGKFWYNRRHGNLSLSPRKLASLQVFLAILAKLVPLGVNQPQRRLYQWLRRI